MQCTVAVVALVAFAYLVAIDGFVARSWRVRSGSRSSSTPDANTAASFATPALVRQALQKHSTSSSSLGMVRTYATAAELLAAAMSDDEDDEEEEESEPAAAPAIIEDGSNSMGGMSPLKAGIQFPTSLNGSEVRVGIIMARWNGDVVQGLYKGINESLALCGVKPTNVFATYVPGAYELPITAKFLAASKRFDVLVCVGCLIKGDTMHFEYIADATANGIMNVAIETMTPVLFGVLTVLNKEQAIVRSTGTGNEGLSWGKSAVEMGLARMSAMGAFSAKEGKDASSSMVVFNASMPTKPGSGAASGEKNETKKFGF